MVLMLLHISTPRYIRTNNTTSAYATHILNNRHEYGNASNTIQLLKKRNKGTRMNCWEAMYIQAYHQEGTLLAEQVTEHNPLFYLGNNQADTEHLNAWPQPNHQFTTYRVHLHGQNHVESKQRHAITNSVF